MRFGLNEARFGGMEYSAAFREVLRGSVGQALQTIANGFLAAGAAAGAIGLGLVVWGMYTPTQRRPLVQQQVVK
jgi:D-alanyl-D-alanine dipeptidase